MTSSFVNRPGRHHAALDLSGRGAALALQDGDGRLLLDAYRPMAGRDSAQLAAWVAAEFAPFDLAPAAVGRWTVGSGPGSFTGMRLAAALVAGLCFGREAQARCVPTALAFAAVANPAVGEQIGVIFDGRNAELLLYAVERTPEGLFPGGLATVCAADSMKRVIDGGEFSRFVAGADAQPAIAKLLPERADRVWIAPQLSAAPLLSAVCRDFDDDLTRLVYIRPAVFTGAEAAR